MVGYIVASIIITLVILVLSLYTISKGYAYKHTVDPIHPKENDQSKNKNA